MPASKDATGTWRAQSYYKDWTGAKIGKSVSEDLKLKEKHRIGKPVF